LFFRIPNIFQDTQPGGPKTEVREIPDLEESESGSSGKAVLDDETIRKLQELGGCVMILKLVYSAYVIEPTIFFFILMPLLH
jgi:hypothetical protein